jgi:hypothetical protein
VFILVPEAPPSPFLHFVCHPSQRRLCPEYLSREHELAHLLLTSDNSMWDFHVSVFATARPPASPPVKSLFQPAGLMSALPLYFDPNENALLCSHVVSLASIEHFFMPSSGLPLYCLPPSFIGLEDSKLFALVT